MHGRGAVPILVGGTHYYLQSVLWNAFLVRQGEETGEEAEDDEDAGDGNVGDAAPAPAPDNAAPDRAHSNTAPDSAKGASTASATDESPSEAYARLQAVDPAMAARLHPNDVRRIRRSLQVRLAPSCGPMPCERCSNGRD